MKKKQKNGTLVRTTRRRNSLLVVAAILAVALVVRLFGMLFSPLEYDEIWSLQNFSNLSVGRILTDLALPNNHPLNSLFVKLWTALVNEPQLIRLHSLVFGVLSVALAGVLARGLFHNRRTALLTMLFLAADAPAIYYSELARGYSIQLFFLLLFACGVAWCGELRRFMPKFLPEAAMIVGAAGAVLAVPSAPIFLAATALCGWYRRKKLPETRELVALGLAALPAVFYLAWNYTALRSAQSWGTRLGSPTEWAGFIGITLMDYVSFAVLPFLLVFAGCDRKQGLPLLICAALIFASAAVVGAGPSRVYLPLCVIVALGCGRGAQILFTVAQRRDNRRLARLLTLAAVALAALGLYQQQETWHVTDYWRWFMAGQVMPTGCFTVYPATAGYPLGWNNYPDAWKDHYARLSDASPGERRLWCFGVDPGRINGLNAAGSEVALPLAVQGTQQNLNGFPAVEYRLRPTDAPTPGESFVIALPPGPRENALALTGRLLKDGCDVLNLNAWLNEQLPGPGGKTYSGRLLYGVAPADPGVWELARNSGSRIYVFTPDPVAR
jgi:hypothetical protein